MARRGGGEAVVTSLLQNAVCNSGVEKSPQEADLKSDGFLNELLRGFSKALLGRPD